MNKFRSESPEVIQLLVRTEIFSKNYVLPPDTHTYVCVAGGKKCLFLVNFVYVLNKWSPRTCTVVSKKLDIARFKRIEKWQVKVC